MTRVRRRCHIVFHSFGGVYASLANVVAVLCLSGGLSAQWRMPYINAGSDSPFARIDFAQILLETTTRDQKKVAEQKAQRQHLVEIGTVSALDLNAPNKALDEYNRAVSLLKEQHSKQAILHLQKAIAAYPKFVLAHNALGLAYLDQQDSRARTEFEAAAKLDDKFPGSFVNLGQLALAANDFATAHAALQKAVAISPAEPKILAALALAQNGDHEYQQALETVRRVHTLDHRGMAGVHYVAAAAAMALNDFEILKSELNLLLMEDPTNPLAPVARKNLEVLARRQSPAVQVSPAKAAVHSQPQTFPNTERLEAELRAVENDASNAGCEDCTVSVEADGTAPPGSGGDVAAAPLARPSLGGNTFTVHSVVDEAALFFAVNDHGRMVNDLNLSDIQIQDDGKPPEKILQFLPQSKLPLRLGLLIDTSGSLESRFSFEKHVAEKFVEKVLNPKLDLAFVTGFSSETSVTRDFSSVPAELARGVETLPNGGGTALFDAVTFACEKLAQYPENERVARVLVVLSDGEDNSSHRSLRQTIEAAEKSGVAIYTVSTADHFYAQTDADNIMQVLAESTGGESMFPGDMQTFGSALDRLRDLIRSRYLVAYRPKAFEPNGKYRSVRIIAEKDGRRLKVHARKGYYARLDTSRN